MQVQVPEVFEVMRESEATRNLYVIGEDATANFGRKCLMARRLAEAGVRYIQVTDNGWEHHAKIDTTLRKRATGIDRPLAGMFTDLKARGLLEDTLVIWTGEFGRTPFDQSQGDARADAGRDHTPIAGRCSCRARLRRARELARYVVHNIMGFMLSSGLC